MALPKLKQQVVMVTNIHYNYPYQRHQVFADFIAEHCDVYFIENMGIRVPTLRDLGRVWSHLSRSLEQKKCDVNRPSSPNIKIICPVVAPPGNIGNYFNKKIFLPRLAKKLKIMGLRNDSVLWTYLPTPTVIMLEKLIGSKTLIYDCATNFSGVPGAPKWITDIESELAHRADLVLADSNYLVEKLLKIRKQVIQLHHGVDISLFSDLPDSDVISKSLCYFGSIRSTLDWKLIGKIADKGYDVFMIGPIIGQIPVIKSKNIHFLPQVSQVELPKILAKYQALLLPYPIDTGIMLGTIPAKIYECIATGKPVITTPLKSYDEELRKHLYLVNNEEEVAATMEHLNQKHDEMRRKKCIKFAVKFSRIAIRDKFEKLLFKLIEK